MASRRQLDSAGSTGTRPRIVVKLVFAILLECASLGSIAASPQIDRIEAVQKLFDEKRWEQVVAVARTSTPRGAEIDYYLGVALAQLGQWDEAHRVLLAGQRLYPADARYPIELGGVAFKQKSYAEAARWLRRGMRLNPADSYTADFLATIYFLQGNLEAALKYWNQIGKPQIQNVRVEPELRVDPVLLDRAFAFAPANTLTLSDFLATRVRLRGLGIFPAFTFHLDARDDGRFDTTFAAQERNGFGKSKLQALLSTFRGIGYQTIYPEYFNLAQSAINIESMVRWDASFAEMPWPVKCRPSPADDGVGRREANFPIVTIKVFLQGLNGHAIFCWQRAMN